jgi:hypothetical protein
MSTMQYIRRCNLIVAGKTGDGLDLGSLHVKFKITKSDSQTPNAADITVYNLTENTAKQIRDEYSRVVLQAGYESNYGVIFAGNIKQVRIGRENGTDTFINIAAGDGDESYNYAVVNQTLAAGTTQRDQIQTASSAMNHHGVTLGYVGNTGTTKLARGKVMYGLARDYLRQSAQASETTWSIQDGKLQVVERTAYLPGQAVVMTSKSGLIGAPEQTDKGLHVRALLNPQLRVGGRIKVDQASITEAMLPNTAAGTPANAAPALSPDGVYRILVVEYAGDNRGNDWYCDLTCLDVDATAPVDDSVSID